MLVVCLLLCAAGGLALVLWITLATPEGGTAVQVQGTGPALEREREPAALAGERQPPPATAAVREGVLQELLPRPGPLPESEPLRLFDRERFDGVGTLRVRARTPPGVPFPEHWTLVLEPSDVLIGGQYARGRRLAVAGGEQELVLEDVPLGGYSVRAEAARMNCERKLILLAQPNERDRPVFLELKPAGFLTGRVLDAEGGDVPGVSVVLEALASGTRRTALTDPAGAYLFEGVLDGEYRLFAGVPESPLAPARELAFTAPSLTMPDIELPVLGQLELLVLEPGDLPAPDLHVTGYGKQGGRIDVTTDEHGEAVARFLPAGWFTVLAHHGDGGRTRVRVELEPGQSRSVVIVLER